MWDYDKKLQYPINIKNPNPQMAKFIISQYGGPDGELGASLRYLSQRFSMPTEITKGILTDIGTEELGHLEMVGTLVSQLTKGVCPEVLKREGLGEYYTDHGISVYPQSAAGIPFSATALAVKGDPVADLYEDMAAEQKARSTYEYLIDLADDPDVINVLKFLREREIVHFQRFGEALRNVQEKLASKKFYMNNMQNNVLGTQTNNCGCNDTLSNCIGTPIKGNCNATANTQNSSYRSNNSNTNNRCPNQNNNNYCNMKTQCTSNNQNSCSCKNCM